jgi:hypothetical protein
MKFALLNETQTPHSNIGSGPSMTGMSTLARRKKSLPSITQSSAPISARNSRSAGGMARYGAGNCWAYANGKPTWTSPQLPHRHSSAFTSAPTSHGRSFAAPKRWQSLFSFLSGIARCLVVSVAQIGGRPLWEARLAWPESSRSRTVQSADARPRSSANTSTTLWNGVPAELARTSSMIRCASLARPTDFSKTA